MPVPKKNGLVKDGHAYIWGEKMSPAQLDDFIATNYAAAKHNIDPRKPPEIAAIGQSVNDDILAPAIKTALEARNSLIQLNKMNPAALATFLKDRLAEDRGK